MVAQLCDCTTVQLCADLKQAHINRATAQLWRLCYRATARYNDCRSSECRNHPLDLIPALGKQYSVPTGIILP